MLHKTKHIIIASSFIFTLFFSAQASAATLNVSQTLTASAGIAITGTGVLTNGVGSATIDITPANATNYVITVSGPATGAFLLTHTNGTDTVPLTVDIDNTAIPTSGSTFTNNAPTNGGTNTHTINLTSGATATSLAGTYSTTLTITVQAN